MIVNLGPLKANLEETGRPIAEALAECDRELNLRIRMYPEWIRSRKLSAIDARDRLERLARACQTLQDVLDLKLDELRLDVEAEAESSAGSKSADDAAFGTEPAAEA